MDQCKSLTEWRQSDPDARNVPVKLQRWTLMRLDQAYRGFFCRVKAGLKAGFPRFRGKQRFSSFGFHEFRGISLDHQRLRFQGMPGGLRVHFHRPIPLGSSIRSCVFRRDVNGWTVGLVIDASMHTSRYRDGMVGIDLGIRTFAVLSDGGFIPSLRAARRIQRRLRIAQRSLARKAHGSLGRNKARAEVARCYGQARRMRANHLHQASARLVRDYAVIAIERLNIKGLSRSRLAKDVLDASWGKFILMLRYKAACAGTRIIEVDSHDTSQECSSCGTKVAKALADTIHDCAHCGLTMDRDLNAARNILYRAGVGPGLRNVAELACVQAETSMKL
jgi:putative transposase